MSKLVDGLIPANTECPFKDKCNLRCKHLGKEHPCPFSCGAARAFDLFKESMPKDLFKEKSLHQGD